MIITGEAIATALQAGRLFATTESMLQRRIGELLADLDVPVEREARLAPGERIDFLVDGRIGIEAKTKYPRRKIYRQLERYAKIEAVDSLILVTGTAMGLPGRIEGKPLFYVSIGRSAL